MFWGILCFVGFFAILFFTMEREDKKNYGDYTMGKYQSRAVKGMVIKSGGANSTTDAHEEGYSRGYQDGLKAYDDFIKLLFVNDLKLEDGEQREYKYKYYNLNSPYDNDYYDKDLDKYYPQDYGYEYMKGYKKGYNDAYDFSLKRNGRMK